MQAGSVSGFRYRVGDRVVVFTQKGYAIHGTVRWVGMYSFTVNKAEQSHKCVGIETDVKVKTKEVEGFPVKYHFVPAKDKGVVYLTENEVLPEVEYARDMAPLAEHAPSYPDRQMFTAGLNQPSTQPGHSIAYAGHPTPALDLGSAVQLVGDHNRHGIVRWLGQLAGIQGAIAGVQLDDPMEGCGADGEWKGVRYFSCPPGRAFFCPVNSLIPYHQPSQDSHYATLLIPFTQHSINPQVTALQVQKYQQSKGLPIESAVREAGLLIPVLLVTGRTLGTGSYGEVIEVKVQERLCAAKQLHGAFTGRDVPQREKAAMVERFEKECRRVLYLSHANIIEMIGVHFDRGTRLPTLIMELMDTSLSKYLETNPQSSVPLSTKYSILHDVACGLLYLHTLPPPLGPIVHRDLTANNILLHVGIGEMVAKIADLGQAKIDSVHATRQQKLSQVPGNDDHMPPEAWMDNPAYNASLDVFSFGVVTLHTLMHAWPKPLARFKSAMEVRSEVERRKALLDKISGNPLKPLVVSCLSQEPGDRPNIRNVLYAIGQHLHPNPLRRVPAWEAEDQIVQGGQIEKYMGEKRGIQGHQNSCYLDATIFGLFALSDVFDSLFLNREQSLTSLLSPSLESPTSQVQREIGDMLWKGIVNPLRKNGVVKYESVMGLRKKLEQLGKMEGVSTAEKNPEEFLNMLFKHTLHVDPFIHIKRPSGIEPEFFVQLFVDLDENPTINTIKTFMMKMFTEQNISFSEVPEKLLIQVPRYNGYRIRRIRRIIPDLKLDPAPFMDTQHACFICNEPAHINCEDCGKFFYLNNSHLCKRCSALVHQHPARVGHTPDNGGDFPRPLELLSVLCIETSHYVCFSRDYEGRWLFFDSMADRIYDQYNIPRGVDCTEQLNQWVYEGNKEHLMAASPRELPELVRRFTQDVYMCVYIQPDYGMYG